MRRLSILLLATLLAGCAADTDPEDRRFFTKGWLFPHRDIDQDPSFDPDPARQQPMPTSRHPDKYPEDPIIGH
jgi:hypothetical protein